MSRRITRADFTQRDSHWTCVIDNIQLNLAPDEQGNFHLTIIGVVEPLPPATQYPTEPEWKDALALVNMIVPVLLSARDYGGK